MTAWQMPLQEVNTTNNIVQIALSALIGGSGICGIVFLFIRHYIERRLSFREEREKKDEELRKKRRKINDRIQHAQGRTLFWLVQIVDPDQENANLITSFRDLQKAEEESKDLDRDILAEHDET